jgi:hypothetical protein
MERDRPEALLDKAGLHLAAERVGLGQVEEGLGQDLAIGRDHFHAPDALDHKDATGAVLGDRHPDGVVEAVGHLDKCELGIARELASGPGYLIGRLRNGLAPGRHDSQQGHRHGKQQRLASSHGVLQCPPSRSPAIGVPPELAWTLKCTDKRNRRKDSRCRDG